MNESPLPEELAKIEARLLARKFEVPATGLRARVVEAVAAELGRIESTRRAQWGPEWWGAIAAAVLLVASLSMVSASQSAFSMRPAGDPAQQMGREMQVIGQLESQQEGALK